MPSALFSSLSEPSWASAIWRQSTRPMPEPPGLVVKNGTNRLDVFESPGPSSSTQMSIAVGCDASQRSRWPAANFEARVGGVANQIDEQLFDLIAVDRDRRVRTGLDVYRDAGFEPGNLDQQRLEHHWRQSGRGQARQARISCGKTAERIGPRGDDLQAARHVVAPVFRWRVALQQGFEAAGDRFDRAQRIAKLVADDANQPLPRVALLFTERAADVRQHQQVVRQPAEPKRRASDLPASHASARQRQIDHARRVAKPRR